MSDKLLSGKVLFLILLGYNSAFGSENQGKEAVAELTFVEQEALAVSGSLAWRSALLLAGIRIAGVDPIGPAISGRFVTAVHAGKVRPFSLRKAAERLQRGATSARDALSLTTTHLSGSGVEGHVRKTQDQGQIQ